MNVLSLRQVTPAINPDTNICLLLPSGQYTQGVGDPLPIGAIQDPESIGQVPLPAVTSNPPPVTPYMLNQQASGYYAQIKRITTPGAGNSPAQVTFNVFWFQPGGAELNTGAYPAQISGGELFVAIPVFLQNQS